MPNEETKQYIDQQIREHKHDGLMSESVNAIDLFGDVKSEIIATPATIATTGNTDWYIIAPFSGSLDSADFSGVDALAANDTNYITFSITNLGRDGSGSTAMLAATDVNTTKATGGSALAANTVRELTLSTSINAGLVKAGDRLRVRAAATGTLANTVTFPVYLLRFK
jgi:hypothetical protein